MGYQATLVVATLLLPLMARDPALNRSTEVRPLQEHPSDTSRSFPDRLMVGQRTLTPLVLVRIQFGDPNSMLGCNAWHNKTPKQGLAPHKLAGHHGRVGNE